MVKTGWDTQAHKSKGSLWRRLQQRWSSRKRNKKIKSKRIKGIMNRRGNRCGKQTDRETCRNIRRDGLIEQHKKTGGKKHVHKDDLLILRVAVRNQGRMCKLSTCHKPESQSAFCNISSQQSTESFSSYQLYQALNRTQIILNVTRTSSARSHLYSTRYFLINSTHLVISSALI